MQTTDFLDNQTRASDSPIGHAAAGQSALSRSRRVDLVVGIVLFALACWQFLGLVDDTDFHRDEARWAHRAEYVRELARPLGSYWDESRWLALGGTLDERYRLRNQPPFGSYVMGLGLLAQGRDLDVNGFWNMDHDDAWNDSFGNMPDPADLEAARRTTAVVSALTVLAVYVIARRLTNPIGGIVAALFMMFNPLVELYAAFAGSDMLLVLMVALATIAAYRLADRPSWPRAILLGGLLGLGGATKLSPLVVAALFAIVGALGVFLAARGLRSPWGRVSVRYGVQLVSLPAVAVFTFVAVYPYLWRAPFDHSMALFEYRKLGMDIQGSIWSHIAVNTPGEALERVVKRLGDDFPVVGRLRLPSGPGLPLGFGSVEVWIAVIGLVLFVAIAIKRGPWSGHALAFAVLGGQAVVTIVGLRADWARYHLPIVLLAAVCIGVVAGELWAVLGRVARRFDSVRGPAREG